MLLAAAGLLTGRNALPTPSPGEGLSGIVGEVSLNADGAMITAVELDAHN